MFSSTCRQRCWHATCCSASAGPIDATVRSENAAHHARRPQRQRMATPLCSSVNETLAKLLKKRPVYAASRMSQLRKSSSAASQSFRGISVAVPSGFRSIPFNPFPISCAAACAYRKGTRDAREVIVAATRLARLGAVLNLRTVEEGRAERDRERGCA